MGFLQSYSSFISDHAGKVILAFTTVIISLLTLTLLLRTLPSFHDPRLGLEARDTLISARLNTWKLLNDENSASSNNLSLNANSAIYEITNHHHKNDNRPIFDGLDNSHELQQQNKNRTHNNPNEPPVIEMSMEHINGRKGNTNSTDWMDEGEEEYYKYINTTSNNMNNLMHYSLDSDQAFCGQLDEGYAQFVIAPTHRQSVHGLLTLHSMLSICQLDQKLRLEHSMEDRSIFHQDCERFQLDEELENTESSPVRHYGSACCNSWSLPNYVACLSNKTSCMTLTQADVRAFEHLLGQCARHYYKYPEEECFVRQREPSLDALSHGAANTLEYEHRFESTHCGLIPDSCMKCGGWTYNVMHYLVNNNFMINRAEGHNPKAHKGRLDRVMQTRHVNHSNPNILTHTNIFLPIAKGPSLMKYYRTLSKYPLKTPHAYVKAMDLGMKNSLFEHLLSEDARLFLIALLAILIVISVHSWSIIVSLVILLIICLSLCASFVIYTLILDIPVFPFMNLLAVVISFGICSDNAMLFCKQWTSDEELSFDGTVNENDANINIRPGDVVTLGTRNLDCVDYSNRGTYDMNNEMIDQREKAGIDRMLSRAIVGTSVATLATACSFVISAISKITAVRCFCIFATLTVITNYILIITLLPAALILDARLSRRFCREMSRLGPRYQNFMSRAQHARNTMIELGKFGNHCILNLVSKYRIYLIITFLTILTCSSIFVFYKPTLQPASEDHVQLLSTKHHFEQYDTGLRKQFAFERMKQGHFGAPKTRLVTDESLPIRVVFGLDAKDNGNMLDPHDRGSLVFKTDFDLADTNSQTWMLDFCKKLKQQRFIHLLSAPETSNCFIETFKSWMESRPCRDPVQPEIDRSPCCQEFEFPFSRTTFNKCVGEAVAIIRKTPQIQPNFNAGVRFFKNSSKVAALVIEYRSNRLYSESFTKMERFFSDIDEWVTWQINNTAPAGMKSGWFISSNLEYLALQTELFDSTTASAVLEILFAMLVLALSTRNVITTIAGTITIVTIITTTVAILILLRWTLGVAESIMISLTIGLSIDFALHYSVAYSEMRPTGSQEAIIHSVLVQVCGPIALATATTLVAGFVVLWSDILAYQELGIFLIVIAFISWMTSTFFLLPLLASVNDLINHVTPPFNLRFLTERMLKMILDKL